MLKCLLYHVLCCTFQMWQQSFWTSLLFIYKSPPFIAIFMISVLWYLPFHALDALIPSPLRIRWTRRPAVFSSEEYHTLAVNVFLIQTQHKQKYCMSLCHISVVTEILALNLHVSVLDFKGKILTWNRIWTSDLQVQVQIFLSWNLKL